jgi:hypothetical protein
VKRVKAAAATAEKSGDDGKSGRDSRGVAKLDVK